MFSLWALATHSLDYQRIRSPVRGLEARAMIPRGRLDINAEDFARACRLLVRGNLPPEEELRHAISDAFPDNGRTTLAALSVRSAWDVLLGTSGWPSHSEILCSAVNIPEMFTLVSHHGFVPVPLDVDRRTLTVDPDEVRRRVTSRTRAILVASLFGSRANLETISSVARENNLIVVEDLAQAYAADGYGGAPAADVSLFSFGLIKSNTALGGAVVRIGDSAWAARCLERLSTWPVRATEHFRRRVARSFALHVVSWPPLYTVIRSTVEAAGMDWDVQLTQLTRGFSGGLWPKRLRYRLGRMEEAFLAHRLSRQDRRWLDRRRAIGERYRDLLPESVRLGDAAEFPSRWVCPVTSRDPAGLVRSLISNRYDATVRASQLTVLASNNRTSSDVHPTQAAQWLPRAVYLPLHPALKEADLERIATIVRRQERLD